MKMHTVTAHEAAVVLRDLQEQFGHLPAPMAAGARVGAFLEHAAETLEAQPYEPLPSHPIWHTVITLVGLSVYLEIRKVGGSAALKPLRKRVAEGHTEYDFGGLYIVTERKKQGSAPVGDTTNSVWR